MTRLLTCLLCLAVAAPVLAAQYRPPARAQALHQAHLQFLLATGEPLATLASARQLAQNALAENSARPLRLALAERLLDYGLLDAAAARYRDDLGRRADVTRNQGWMRLARAWQQRGLPQRALGAVQEVYGLVDESAAGAAGALEGRLLLLAGQPEAAAKRLRLWQRRHRDGSVYGRYNLAVALARSGHNLEAAGELNAIGRMDADTDETKGLRDKANLVLAYGFLQLSQGATARALFERVRLDGPYSNRALLGLGWAELAPDGEPQELALLRPIRCLEDPARLLPESLPVLRRPPRDACGPPRMFRAEDVLARDPGENTEAARYRRALVSWLELAKRDPAQLAVQEALVAIPYAYAKLEDYAKAEAAFQNAIAALEARAAAVTQVRARMAATAGAWRVSLEAQPAGQDGKTGAAWLRRTLASDGFKVLAANRDDLTELGLRLAQWSKTLNALDSTVQQNLFSIISYGGEPPPLLLVQQQTLAQGMDRVAGLTKRVQALVTAHDAAMRHTVRAAAGRYHRYVETYLAQARRGQARLYETLSMAAPRGEMP